MSSSHGVLVGRTLLVVVAAVVVVMVVELVALLVATVRRDVRLARAAIF